MKMLSKFTADYLTFQTAWESEYLLKIAPLFTAFKKILGSFVCRFGTYVHVAVIIVLECHILV